MHRSADKLSKLLPDDGGLLNFSLDSSSTTLFEGVDYDQVRWHARWRALRTAAHVAAPSLTGYQQLPQKRRERAAELKGTLESEALRQVMSVGRRERRVAGVYNEQKIFRDAVAASAAQAKGKPLPRALRLPRMDYWQFYNKERLQELRDVRCRPALVAPSRAAAHAPPRARAGGVAGAGRNAAQGRS